MVSGNWLHAIVRSIDARGFDGREVALGAGVSRRALANPQERLAAPALNALWRAAVETTGDPAIGLSVWQHLTPATFGALAYGLFASTDLRSFFQRLCRYQRVLSDAIDVRLERDGDDYRWIVERRPPHGPADEGIDGFFAATVRSVRRVSSPDPVEAVLVSLRRPEPSDPSPYAEMFRAPIRFGAETDSLTYHRRDVERSLADGNGELAERNDHIVSDLLEALDEKPVAAKVRRALLDLLPEGPTEQEVARKLGMSKSSLHVALSREDTTYRGILNRTREDLARSYLSDGRCTIKEVAFLLGFSDASTFSRAFKRWMGESPLRYAARVRRRR